MKKLLIRLSIMAIAIGIALSQQDYWKFTPKSQQDVIKDQDLPPTLYMSSVALGPIRGIISNILWLRAEEKQRSKDFHEAVQLTQWISQMQPRVPSIWVYLGWNLSYNISHEYSDKEERWQWILRGLMLMMDQGVKMNPDSIAIRAEIARILFDKIGRAPDIEGRYFNKQWTFLMMEYFDTSAPNEIALLHKSVGFEDFLKSDTTKKFLAGLKDPDNTPLNIAKYPPHIQILNKIPKNSSAYNFYYNALWAYRRSRIENELHLDIDHLAAINKKFGPFDWRLHHGHVMYWLIPDIDSIDIHAGTSRTKMIRQNLQDAFFNGLLKVHPTTRKASKSSNIFIVKHVFDIYSNLFDTFHANSEPSKSEIEDYYHLETSFKAFLKSAFGIMFLNGKNQYAREIFNIYKNQYLPAKSKTSFEDFILISLNDPDALEYREQAHAKIRSLLIQSFNAKLVNDSVRSQRFEEMARRLHKAYTKKHRHLHKKKLPAYKDMIKATRANFEKLQEKPPVENKLTVDKNDSTES